MGAVNNTNPYYQIIQPLGLNVRSIGGGTPTFKAQLTGGNNEGFLSVKDDHRPTLPGEGSYVINGINKNKPFSYGLNLIV